MTTDAEAYKRAQYYGRALIEVRTKKADLTSEGSETYRALIKEPFTEFFVGKVSLIEWSLEDEDEDFTQKLLWWHARVVTGSFLPAEIARMILDLYPGSHPDLGFSL